MSTNPYKEFGLSCPNGGDFHICENTKREFIGCCTMDPCADGSGVCDKAHLRAASFSESRYLDIPPQSCDSTGGENHFYTCTANDPPFLGCCTINPCVNMTCPSANLRAAVLSSDADDRASFLAPSSSSRGGKPTIIGKPPPNGLSSGGVAGIVISVIAILILVAGFVLWRRYNWNPFNSSKLRLWDTPSPGSFHDSPLDKPKATVPERTDVSASSTHPPSVPRSATYSPPSVSALPLYKQNQSTGHQNSPDRQVKLPQTSTQPPPVLHPRRDNSGNWPLQSPSHETQSTPSPKVALQSGRPSHQSVHELLAEVQTSKPEPPVEDRTEKLRSSCVVQPLRPPPHLKGRLSGGIPDSPTLGLPLNAHPVHPKAQAVLDGRSAESSAPKDRSAHEKSLPKIPKTHHARGGQHRKEGTGLSFDKTNFI